MSKLVETIELAARAAFGSRIATVSDAPGKVIRTLAFDDAIEVAAPVLAHSARLDDATLVENARTKSQGHLLAISGRSILAEAVTDILVERGNHQVVAGTAGNRGAKFSASGMSTLVKRAQDNGDLALCVWSRPDIPRHDLVKLFAQASEIVRGKLEAADPRRAALIRTAVARGLRRDPGDGARRLRRACAGAGACAVAAFARAARRGAVARLRARGEFRQDRRRALADVRSSDRADRARAGPERAGTAACSLPRPSTCRGKPRRRSSTLQAGRGGVTKDRLNQCLASFFRLQPKTARTALQFYRLREKANRDSLH